MLLTYHSLTMLLTSMCSPILLIIYPLKKSMCIIAFDLRNFKAERAISLFLLHFFFLLKEILIVKRMKNNF